MSRRRSIARALALLVGMISLVATSVGLLYGDRLAVPEPTDTDAYASGPLGHRALVELYEELGIHVLVDREGVSASAGAPVFFVEPSLSVIHRGQIWDLQDILHARAEAGRDSVVVLPKWHLQGDGDGRVAMRPAVADVRWLAGMALDWPGLELRREDIAIPETARLREWTVPGRRGPRRVVLQERQTLRVHDDDIEVLLGTPRSALVVAVRPRGGPGTVVVISDPDLLHNYNLHRGDHALILLDLLDALHTDTVVIDEVLHGHGFELTLAGVLGRFPTVLIVVHALLLALACAWAGLGRFGTAPVLHSSRPGSHALVDIAARAMCGSARRGRALTVSYVCIVLAEIAERLGIAPAGRLDSRAAKIDEIAERRGLEGGAARIMADISRPYGIQRPLLAIVRDVHRLRGRLLSRGEHR